jgi:hypothetical protein
METGEKKEFPEKRGEFWLWFGFLLPPAAWIVQLQTVYLTSERACANGDFMPNHLVSIFALLAALTGGIIAWSKWLHSGKKWKSEEANPTSRARFMAILGMATGALFTLVIFAQWLPTLTGVPCDK